MAAWLLTWWVWAAAAIVFGILEVLLPAFIFLGFTLGAAATAILAALGWLPGGALWAIVIFAALSLVAYIALRFVLGGPTSETKVITRDINE